MTTKEGKFIINHKGKVCCIDGKTFCQEGYCEDCWIFLEAKGIVEKD